MPIGETSEWRARINPFDHRDVELGTVMADEPAPELQSDQAPDDADSSTNALIRLLRGPLGVSAAPTRRALPAARRAPGRATGAGADHAEVMTFTGEPWNRAPCRAAVLDVRRKHQGDDMQTALHALTARVAEVTHQSLGTYLPWSPLTGIGRASDLAAWHPAFAIDAENDPRFDA
jgi:hypothetical protein